MLAWSYVRWMAEGSVVAIGLLGAIAANPAIAQQPAYTPPAGSPPTKDGAEINRLRNLLGDASKRMKDVESRANDAEKRASDAERRANDAAKSAGDSGKRASDAGKRANDAERRAIDAENRANDMENQAREAGKRAEDAVKRASDAEDNAAKAMAAANERAKTLRTDLEQVSNARIRTQKDLEEARAEVQKHLAINSEINSQIETLNSRIVKLDAVARTRSWELLLFPAVALLLGGGLGVMLARVFPKPRPRISVPPGATVRAHVVLNMAQSRTRIEGACLTGPNVRVAATLGPGITQLIFPEGASR